MSVRSRDPATLAPRRPAVVAHHVGGGRRLVEEDEGVGIEFVLDLVGLGLGRTGRGDEPLHGGVGPSIAALSLLAGQAHGAEIGEGRDALAQVHEVGGELARTSGLAGTVGWWFEAALDVLPDCLRITPCPAGDGSDRQPLSVQVEDHEEFSQQDHPRRSRPIRIGRHGGAGWISLRARGALRALRPGHRPGNFRCPQSGSIQRPLTAAEALHLGLSKVARLSLDGRHVAERRRLADPLVLLGGRPDPEVYPFAGNGCKCHGGDRHPQPVQLHNQVINLKHFVGNRIALEAISPSIAAE